MAIREAECEEALSKARRFLGHEDNTVVAGIVAHYWILNGRPPQIDVVSLTREELEGIEALADEDW